MKQPLYVVLFLLGVTVLASAQQPWKDVRGQNRRETISLNGTLEVVNGRIALKTGQQSYFIHGLRPLIGFVDDLKEGASVSLEGFVLPNNFGGMPHTFRVTKVAVGNKSYELPLHHEGNYMMRNHPGPHNYGFPGPDFPERSFRERPLGERPMLRNFQMRDRSGKRTPRCF